MSNMVNLQEHGRMRMYINGHTYVGEASLSADPDSRCLVCASIYEEYAGEMEENVEEIKRLNETFDHTLGDNCAIRSRCEQDPWAPDVETLVEKFGDDDGD